MDAGTVSSFASRGMAVWGVQIAEVAKNDYVQGKPQYKNLFIHTK